MWRNAETDGRGGRDGDRSMRGRSSPVMDRRPAGLRRARLDALAMRDDAAARVDRPLHPVAI